jgi:hypothetical protein
MRCRRRARTLRQQRVLALEAPGAPQRLDRCRLHHRRPIVDPAARRRRMTSLPNTTATGSAAGNAGFQTTRWSRVLRASADDPALAGPALTALHGLLVSALRFHSAVGLRSRRRPRPHAGVLHPVARKEMAG